MNTYRNNRELFSPEIFTLNITMNSKINLIILLLFIIIILQFYFK